MKERFLVKTICLKERETEKPTVSEIIVNPDRKDLATLSTNTGRYAILK